MKPTITLDEIMEMITEVARNPDSGADRFRAIKMLKEDATGNVTIGEDLSDGEVIDRLKPLLLAAGRQACQIAFRRAFPTSVSRHNVKIEDTPDMIPEELPTELVEMAGRITSLKMLYKEFPECKRPGAPKGYPVGRSKAVQYEWLKHAAIRLALDRENRKLVGPPPLEGMDAIVARAQAGPVPDPEWSHLSPIRKAEEPGREPQGVPVADQGRDGTS